MVGSITVREHAIFLALLRLPSYMSHETKMQRVDEVISSMGLVEVQDSFIGSWMIKGISGGQKRRLAIACELITRPTLLFLDEPTSGLDAASAFFVISSVRSLAEEGRTVLTVIHQVSGPLHAYTPSLLDLDLTLPHRSRHQRSCSSSTSSAS